MKRVLIVDGYTDEPAGLGVPPYLDVYPRYAYGATILAKGEAKYLTIDQVRRNVQKYVELAKRSDLIVIIAGVLVPGKYLGGEPIRDVKEIEWLTSLVDNNYAIAGPAARYGIGGIGGRRASEYKQLERYGILVRGDLEAWLYQYLEYGESYADPYAKSDWEFIDQVAVKGSKIVKEHPNMNLGNLIIEIETMRGCPRSVVGGCSFCSDAIKGKLTQRPIKSIVREIETLYLLGVRHFRLGRQSDILVYGSDELVEWPKPKPGELEKLFKGIRHVAPSLGTLHIDNVNPGTIVRHEKESVEALKVIVKYHTPGDVAALGIESVDPKVVKLNNLKVDLEGAIRAIEIVNRVGRKRGWNGLPHLLPGINFIGGLIGESKETWEWNIKLLEEINKRSLMVRRVNVRQVSILPGTSLWRLHHDGKPSKGFRRFREIAMTFQKEMLRKIVPKGTILRYLMVEKCERGICYARQPASYPITVEIADYIKIGTWVNVKVQKHHARSVVGLVTPVHR